MDGRKLSAYAGEVSRPEPDPTPLRPWLRSACAGALAGAVLVLLEALLAWVWPAPGASLSLVDLALALALTCLLGALGGLLARLVWRRAPTVIAWVPLAAALAPQLLRPFELDYAWDPVLSGVLVVLVWLLPRVSAGLAALVILAAPALVSLGLDRGHGGELLVEAPAGASGPDILLITVDTLRADAGLELPEYERWQVFDQAISGAPWTLPSMISLFGGAPVREHLGGLPAQRGGGYTQARQAEPWLPGALAAQGYRCAAFTSNPYLTRGFGFDRGFERFVHADAFREPFLVRRSYERVVHQLTGRVERLRRERDARVVEAAQDWLAGEPAQPWFLWVHLLAPHEYSRDTFGAVGDWAPGTENPQALRGAYRANVAGTQRLVDQLVGSVEPTSTLVVFTADHGEQLGEEGVFGHGLALGDSELRVPLALRGPGVEPGVVTQQVLTADLQGLLLAVATGAEPRLAARELAPVGGLRGRNKAGSFAFRLADGGQAESPRYQDDPSAAMRARVEGDGPLIVPDASTREALRALGYVE